MTKQLRKAIEILGQNLTPMTVLEIGSRQAKNQKKLANFRSLFPAAKYLGTDMIDGSGVDQVADAENLPFSDASFDLVLCLETFEHARKPWLVAAEIERVVSDKGIIIVSSQQSAELPTPQTSSRLFPLYPVWIVELI